MAGPLAGPSAPHPLPASPRAVRGAAAAAAAVSVVVVGLCLYVKVNFVFLLLRVSLQ